MQIVEKEIEVIHMTPNAERIIADAARTCFRSESKSDEYGFLRGLIKSHHMSPFEHAHATVRITCSRATTHELVRHRLASYNQESQRYCNYSKSGVAFIRPNAVARNPKLEKIWLEEMEHAEKVYNDMLAVCGVPGVAREVLPESTATTIRMTANFREWMTVFDQRLWEKTGKPHEEIQCIMATIFSAFNRMCPIFPLEHPIDPKNFQYVLDVTRYE